MSTETTPKPATGKKWKLKNPEAQSVKHWFLGTITADHLNGPRGDRFIKALKKLDADKAKQQGLKEIDSWLEQHFVQA